MENSLKTILYQAIKNARSLMLNDIEAICHLNNAKISAGERRLRELMESKMIGSIRNDKGAIIGYKWIAEANQSLQYKTPKEVITDGLDDELRLLLRNIPSKDLYARQSDVAELNRAIKSNNEYLKKCTIEKFKLI